MLAASNCRWIQFDQWCNLGASATGAPITIAIVCDGYGLANASTNSQRTVPPPLPQVRGRPWRRTRTRLRQQLRQEAPHRRPVALDRARAQGGVHEAAQPRVIGAR